jgi:tRNA pseudouridine55 synthase
VSTAARAGGPAPGPDGLVVVDKPAGPTSHDVVARMRRLYGTRRVGHAGTLDPPATGVLLVGLGRATRLLRFLQHLPKTYEATVAFGVETTTQDATGDVVARRPCTFAPDELHAAAASFVGPIEQVPPMVSAVKIGGEPLYRAARRGEVVERPPRAVTVHELSVAAYDPAAASAQIRVRCSSGTYIRTLASDLGDRLRCGAHLRSLRRTAIGSFSAADAVGLADLEAMEPPERARHVLPLAEAMRDFPSLTVEGEALQAVRNGRPLPGPPGGAAPVAVLEPGGDLVAVYEPHGTGLRAAAVVAPAGQDAAAAPAGAGADAGRAGGHAAGDAAPSPGPAGRA